jgi:hypothetical protein
MPDPNQREVGEEKNAKALELAAFESLDARLRRLEEPEKPSRLSRLQKNLSFAALMIGILLSTISVYDTFWSKPRQSLFKDLDDFNKAVNAVANLRQQMIQSAYKDNNPELTLALNGMVQPQILANIQYATALLPRIGEHARVPQLIVLISEAMNIYDWKSAEVLVDRAIASPDAVPSMQSEARRYKGRLLFLTGRIQDGRRAFEDSLTVIAKEPGFGINGVRAYVVGEWALMELSLGDCSIAQERIRDFVRLIQHPQIAGPLRAALISTVKTQAAQPQEKGCQIPAELSALQATKPITPG